MRNVILFISILLIFNSLSSQTPVTLENNNNLLPLKKLDTVKIAYLQSGLKKTAFYSGLLRYAKIDMLK